jgi:hypothetical protein
MTHGDDMTDDERDAGDDRSGAEDGTASTAEHSVDDWLAAAQTSPAAGRRRRGERRDAGPDEKRRGGGMAVPIIAVSVAVATVIGASFVIFGDALGLRGDETSAGPATISASARPGAAQGGPSRTPTPTPTPTPSGEPTQQAATAAPADAALPAPSVATVPAGTVVSESDVRSPLGSVAFHYRVVADGSNGYDIEYSGFTSTLPVPVSVTLIDIPPKVGDGMTSSGVGSVLLGGPTTSPASGRVALGTSQPSYLGTIVTYSSATSADGVPLEIGPGKVLAVSSVGWSIPPRETNIAPVDSGPASLAAGQVGSTTDSGAPRRYVVAPNDAIAEVAARFDISVAALIYLNAGLQVLGDDQRLFEGTTLNLDPAAV